MANRTLRVLLKKIYTDGSIDTIYLKSRASDVFLDGSSTDTLASIVTKVNGIQEGATAVSSNATNGYISINGTATQVYAHPNSGVTAGTYNSVTVNAAGHVTAGTSNSYLLSSSKVTFTTASTKANIVSNSDTIAVMLGKLAKWYTSFGSLAWLSSVGTSQLDTTLSTAYNQRVVTGTDNTTASVTESREITAAGYVADARAVANLQNQINTINSSLDNISSKTILTETKVYTNIDLNTLTTQQICFYAVESNMMETCHCPRMNGWLWVIPESSQGWIKQIIFVAGTIDNSDMYMYTRLYQNGQWGNWHTFMSYKKVMTCTNWAYLKTLNSTNGYTATLPYDWKELYIATYIAGSGSYVASTYIIRRDTVNLSSTGSNVMRSGYSKGGSTPEEAEVVFGIYPTTISFLYAFKDGADVKNTSNARVYVKHGYYFYDTVNDVD